MTVRSEVLLPDVFLRIPFKGRREVEADDLVPAELLLELTLIAGPAAFSAFLGGESCEITGVLPWSPSVFAPEFFIAGKGGDPVGRTPGVRWLRGVAVGAILVGCCVSRRAWIRIGFFEPENFGSGSEVVVRIRAGHKWPIVATRVAASMRSCAAEAHVLLRLLAVLLLWLGESNRHRLLRLSVKRPFTKGERRQSHLPAHRPHLAE